MNKPNPKVDGYIRKNKEWQPELQKLREILLNCPLVEDVKWRAPCYTYEGHNVAFIGPMKSSCVLSFIKGSLLKDARKILIQQTENSQSVRIIRFASLEEITKLEPVLRAYINEAIDLEKAGVKVAFKKIDEFKIPEELQSKFDEMPELKSAFKALTPGRQRGYLLHFCGAKQSKTRTSRVEKCVEKILNGKGMDDE